MATTTLKFRPTTTPANTTSNVSPKKEDQGKKGIFVVGKGTLVKKKPLHDLFPQAKIRHKATRLLMPSVQASGCLFSFSQNYQTDVIDGLFTPKVSPSPCFWCHMQVGCAALASYHGIIVWRLILLVLAGNT